MVIALSLIALLGLIFVGVGIFALLSRIISLLFTVGFSLLIGSGLGAFAALIVSSFGGDAQTFGVAVGLLTAAGTIIILERQRSLPKRKRPRAGRSSGQLLSLAQPSR